VTDVPLGDLIYDLLHAIVLDDPVEQEQASLALAKATAKAVSEGRCDGSPTLPDKLKRLRTRLKQSLAKQGFHDTDPDDGDDDGEGADDWGAPAAKPKRRRARARDDDDLPSIEDLD